MPDITMCNNNECILNSDCYRYNAEPNPYWQSWSYFEPSGENCDYYIEGNK